MQTTENKQHKGHTMAKVKKNVKTKVGKLKYIFIEGEGRNQAMADKEPRMMYVASIVAHKDSDIVKDMEAKCMEVWDEYKTANGLKPASKPDTIGIKVVKDPDTDAETDDRLITFKTDVAWPDGNKKEIKVLDPKGTDITKAVHSAPWSIGNDSEGIIHGVAEGNNTGSKHKVSLYLSAIQLAKLVKYEGTVIEADEIEGADDLDLGEDLYAAIGDGDQSPEL